MLFLSSYRHSLQIALRHTPKLTRSITQTAHTTLEVGNNLNRIKAVFQDKHGVFDKSNLVSKLISTQLKQSEGDSADVEPSSIRIGLIGAKNSLLNTILADPFASEQSWFEEFKNRGELRPTKSEPQGNRLVKYGEIFQKSKDRWELPTPFLNTESRNGLEFLEIDQFTESTANDGCHLYFSFNDELLNDSIRNWPVYSWRDINSVKLTQLRDNIDDVKLPKLTISEINSEIAEFAIELLRESPKNSTLYTKLTPFTNILDFIHQIDQLIIDKNLIIAKLYQSILKNVENQLQQNSLTLRDLELKDQRIVKYISQWSELTHHEFQHVFKPFVNQYERKQLPWWKLYLKADEVQHIIKKMFDTQLLNNSVKNYSYVKGQIDSFSSFPTKNVALTNSEKFDFSKDLSALPTSNSLSVIKTELIVKSASDLQKQALKLLLINFMGLQLPVVLVSIFGHTLYDFSVQSMAALGSLGLVLGFNNVSRKWVDLIETWKLEVFEKIRLAINEENQQLVSEWESRYEKEKEGVKAREELIESLRGELKKLM
jgi:PKD repeat protein